MVTGPIDFAHCCELDVPRSVRHLLKSGPGDGWLIFCSALAAASASFVGSRTILSVDFSCLNSTGASVCLAASGTARAFGAAGRCGRAWRRGRRSCWASTPHSGARWALCFNCMRHGSSMAACGWAALCLHFLCCNSSFSAASPTYALSCTPRLSLFIPLCFAQELLRRLDDRHSTAGDRLYSLLCRCLEQGSWRQHCQRLLLLLPQQDLLPFAVDLLGGSSLPKGPSKGSSGGGGGVSSDAAQQAAACGGAWLVFRQAQWQSLEQLTLAAALGCSLPLLLRLLRDEEWEDERQAIGRAVHRLLLPSTSAVLPPTGGAAEQPEQVAGQPAQQQQQMDQQQVLEREQQQAEQQQQHVAAHWCLRRQLVQQWSSASEAQLQEMLLLHLFAAAFLVQQLSSSGSREDAEQLQQLLASSGLPFELVAAASPAGERHAEHGERRRRSSSKHKRSKRRHSSKHSGSSRKEKRRKKKKRRRSGYSSSGSSSGSEASDSGGSYSEDEGAVEPEFFGAAAIRGEPAQRLWRLRRPDGSSSTVSSLELLDCVIDSAAWAYSRWLFGRA